MERESLGPQRTIFPADSLPEIEKAFVATLWHQPDRLAEVLRWLVLEIHLSLPYLRIVVNALADVYVQLNAADWSSIVACIAERGQLEECGGKEELDQLYEARWYEPLFPFYCEAIQRSGSKRSNGPVLPPRFSGGTATLFYDYRLKRYSGTARIAGKLYRITGKTVLNGINLNFFPND